MARAIEMTRVFCIWHEHPGDGADVEGECCCRAGMTAVVDARFSTLSHNRNVDPRWVMHALKVLLVGEVSGSSCAMYFAVKSLFD